MTIAAVLIAGAPLVLATLGETLTEKAGIINLSLDGSILLSAMAAFAVATTTGSPWLGVLGGMGVGAAVAGVLGLIGIYLGQSQLAVGFVLTLLCRDLAYFLGHDFSRQPGPDLGLWTIPGIKGTPFIGSIFGATSPVVYMGLAAIFLCWWWMFRTEGGIRLRAVGESPRAAFGRGIRVRLVRFYYCLAGGALVGLAGAAYSLAVKPGWGRPQGCEGAGWIALAIVIFGGLASGTGRPGRVLLCRAPGLGHLSPGNISVHPGPGLPGSPVPHDDPDPAGREHGPHGLGPGHRPPPSLPVQTVRQLVHRGPGCAGTGFRPEKRTVSRPEIG